jgi:hypothetical protein
MLICRYLPRVGKTARPTAINSQPGLTKHSEETQANSHRIHPRLRLRSARRARARPYGLPRRRDVRVAQRIAGCSGNEHRARDCRSKESDPRREVAEFSEERTAPSRCRFAFHRLRQASRSTAAHASSAFQCLGCSSLRRAAPISPAKSRTSRLTSRTSTRSSSTR